MRMKTEDIFVYEESKVTELSDLFVKMLEEGLDTLSTENPANTAEAIRFMSIQGTLQNGVKETRLKVALKRFNEELKKYLETVDYYTNQDFTYEEERLSRVITKYQKYKNLFRLSDFDLNITENMVNKFWKKYYAGGYMDWYSIKLKISISLRIDNYINRFSTIMSNAGGKIKGYPSTLNNIEKMRFLMSVDLIVAMIALEDYCKYEFNSWLSISTYNDYLLMSSIEQLVTEIKLTEQGKERCKAILDIILPEQFQPEEFKAIIKK